MRIEIASGPAAGRALEVDRALVLGRDDDCDVVLDDDKASRRHAILTPGSDGTIEVEDLGSTNGTYVDGRRVQGRVALRPGGTLTIGSFVAFVLYAQRFYRPISDLSEKFNMLQGAMASSERIFRLLDTPPLIETRRYPVSGTRYSVRYLRSTSPSTPACWSCLRTTLSP